MEGQEVKINPMRTVLLHMTPDGGLLQETAPLNSVELSQSAAQAKEAGQQWAVTVKCYHSDLAVAGGMSQAEMMRQTRNAKVEAV